MPAPGKRPEGPQRPRPALPSSIFRFSLEILRFFLRRPLGFGGYPWDIEATQGGITMDMQVINEYLTQYGGIAVFVIVLLEYMNMPGFPAGVILPLAGIWAARGNLHFALVLGLSVAAGLVGSWALYLVGRLGGTVFLAKLLKRFPKQAPAVEKTMAQVRDKGYAGVFVAKLVPAVRTLISIPAGVVRMNFAGYTFFSLMGIVLWNLAFIGAGYFAGEQIFSMLPF